MRAVLVLAAAAIAIASPARAWGDRGHRAIADIAWTQLTSASKRDVAQLLAAAPELATPACPVGSFEDGATWADCVRSRYRDSYAGTAKWHYVDVSVCARFRLPDDPEARFVVARYRREAAILADRTQPRVVRLEALLWVAHLVGDLHQPLHVGDAGDRGGNKIEVYPQNGRYRLNLHAEWDRVLVDETIEQTPDGIARMAVDADRAAKAARRNGGSPEVWARESWELARRIAYSDPAGRCGRTAAPVEVGDAYDRAAVPVVRDQLERAGVRLAVVLNSAFVSDVGQK